MKDARELKTVGGLYRHFPSPRFAMVSNQVREEMNAVAKSASLSQLRTFLRKHPETLNEYVSASHPQDKPTAFLPVLV